MNRISNKAAAEAILRELPSVLGAYVSEDLEGHPREIHLLIRHGPDTAGFARDIRGLLEERLGIPIDQRVISIAQLAPEPEIDALPEGAAEELASAEAAGDEATPDEAVPAGGRPVFDDLESTVSSGRVRVGVSLAWRDRVSKGEAEAVDTQVGRARAAANATLASAVSAPWSEDLNLELDFASIVQALDGEYVLVSVLGISGRLGRRPLPLVGAHPIESDVETAASLATLKAVNRILTLALRPGA